MPEWTVVRFKELYITSIALFVLGVFLIPINQLYSTLVFFGIIGLWTRVPTFFADFLKDLEQVDFLTIMIAIHVGGPQAGLFGMVVMLFSRLFAPLEWPLYTLKDSISFLVSGLSTPFIYAFWGQNLLLTAYTFTVIRWLFYLILTVLIDTNSLGIEIPLLITSIPIAFLMNTGSITIFAPLIEPIIKNGFGFNIELIGVILAVLICIGAAQYLSKRYHKLKKSGHEMVEPQWSTRHGTHA